MIKFSDEICAQLKVWKNRFDEPPNKFIILSYGRSGSGLLRTLINCHPEIFCDDEIYLHYKALFPKRYLENRSKMFEKKYYGHKAKLFQLENQYSDIEKIKEVYLSGVKIIYLKRNNILRQAISGKIGLQRKIWHDTEHDPLEGKTFIISPANLYNAIRRIIEFRKKEQEILDGMDYLPLSYEDDLLYKEDHQKTLDRVFQFLGVRTVLVHSPYVKTVPENLEDVIENYKEVIDFMRNSKYAYFLNDFTSTR